MITATTVLTTTGAAFAESEPDGKRRESPGTATEAMPGGDGSVPQAAPVAHRRTWRPAAERKVRFARKNRTFAHRNKEVAFQLVTERAWSVRQFRCLDRLWTRESGWNHQAAGPSGAYGIPQAMPGHKMASAGADWRSNPVTQIRWGLDYIESRYGSPCQAWNHFRSHRWY
ncbi:transglycosylase SLT domain-containing protein [Thermostaphylospora chromogena]|uniref:Transglycosylase SLT domain-containing protein n=1 Tax=Thermostaphylospora chromogena TaxID=35622 RepID=A0A1H1HUT4_9ACTN|nr:transglycosylase SLT domain-containing protein [Thermostaphylospora chromogena]SDR29079.1 Transglycosylase SLT domain-containing protein [Thermostaphylospora chromogena]